jgi:mono/diheme cytochrome c family protein
MSWALAVVAILAISACNRSTSSPVQGDAESASVTAVAESGDALFSRYCQRCHGPAATGSNFGPPLVHKIYEPGHHPDAAFYRAVQGGVRAHHWQFGNMPPVAGVGNAQVTEIIAYVRQLQRNAGIN